MRLMIAGHIWKIIIDKKYWIIYHLKDRTWVIESTNNTIKEELKNE